MINGITLLADEAPKLTEPVASGLHLVLAFLVGIAVIVVLITIVKLHPFLSLMFGALTVGVVAGRTSPPCWRPSPRASARPPQVSAS